MTMNLIDEMYRMRRSGTSFVIATIVRTSGSVPRAVGAKMLVRPDRTSTGTIGGGNFEKLVIDDSIGLFDGSDCNLLKRYRLAMTGDDAAGQCCGGEAEVFMEMNRPAQKLIIFGGGHVGGELVRLSHGLGFKVVVVDDRAEVLARLSPPVETVQIDLDYSRDLPQIDGDSYVVIVTRSHLCDRSVLKNTVGRTCPYLGMIGSRAKIAKMFKSLEEDGIDRALLQKVHTPIGLDIKAEGPVEIAIAIIAEIIAVRNKVAAAGQ